MGSLKDYMIDLQDEKEEWIREQLDDPDADERHPLWSAYETSFYDMKLNETTVSDILWYSNQTNKSLYAQLSDDLDQLKEIIAPGVTAVGFEGPLHKMVYAYSVTLLETFLSDTVKSLILSHDIYFENALRNVEELKKTSVNLITLWASPDGVKGIALQKLSEILYHNIPKVKEMIDAIVGRKLNINMSKVNQIISFRHDIAHRNGKTQEGDDLYIDAEVVEEAINSIEEFAAAIHSELESLPF